MSTMKIEERITVSAPPDRVWKFLLDPARVAGCLPGAKLDGVEGERTFLGTMKVKVGPVLMEFKGKATMSEVDEAGRRVTMTGTGNDKSGGGSAKMDMKSYIVALDGGGSEIVVSADVDVAGKLVRFGRGMMEGISKQLFKQFAERVRAELATPEEPAAEEPVAEAPAAEAPVAEQAAPAAKETASKEAEAPPAAKEEAPKEAASLPTAKEEAPKEAETPATEVVSATASEVAAQEVLPVREAAPQEKAPEEAKEEPGATQAAPKKAAAKPKKAAPLAVKAPEQENAPLDAGSLVWATIWAWLKGLFGRVFGKRS